MTWSTFLAAFMTTVLGSFVAHTEQPSSKIPRVGILTPADTDKTPVFDAFRLGLRELGYAEGRNIILEFRLARGDYTAIPRLAGELANVPVDIIVTDGGTTVAQTAASVARTVPIVMGTSGDPVALGLARSLARPGGNVTGFTLMAPEFTAKRVDLMRAAFPDALAMTFLSNPSNVGADPLFDVTKKTAGALGLAVTRVEAASPEALRALPTDALRRAGAPVLVMPDPMFWNHRRDILELIAAARLPALYPEREYADDGGLMAYGPNVPDNFRRAAGYVDRILHGAKPGDLPIQEPAKFDFIVNLKTAKALGLSIPPLILAFADEVIE
jgi:putative ABC transport system substrate-binding protein